MLDHYLFFPFLVDTHHTLESVTRIVDSKELLGCVNHFLTSSKTMHFSQTEPGSWPGLLLADAMESCQDLVDSLQLIKATIWILS